MIRNDYNANMKKISLITLISLILIFMVGCQVQKITIHFDSNGGSSVSSYIDTQTNFVMPEDPTKENFEFAGWFWDNETFNNPLTLQSILDLPLSSNMEYTVYAKWISLTDNEPETSCDILIDSVNIYNYSYEECLLPGDNFCKEINVYAVEDCLIDIEISLGTDDICNEEIIVNSVNCELESDMPILVERAYLQEGMNEIIFSGTISNTSSIQGYRNVEFTIKNIKYTHFINDTESTFEQTFDCGAVVMPGDHINKEINIYTLEQYDVDVEVIIDCSWIDKLLERKLIINGVEYPIDSNSVVFNDIILLKGENKIEFKARVATSLTTQGANCCVTIKINK